MLPALYSAAAGMEGQQNRLNSISNDIANVNTTGYKKSRCEFQDVLYQTIKPAGADVGTGNTLPTGVQLGHGSQLVSNSKIFSQGDTVQTDSPFDVTIDGEGFLEVERADGTSAYTRDGALKVNSSGQITTLNGLLLKGLGTVPSNYVPSDVSISQTGYVTIKTASGNTQFQIPLVRFQNPAGLKSMGGNLYEATDASGSPESGTPMTDGFGRILQYSLEGSNVNVVQSMVDMIVAQRAYEINSKSVHTADELLGQISNLKR